MGYYYQLGGFKSHIFHWFKHDTRALADFVYRVLSAREGKETIELVLGILNTGASYILVSEDQLETLLNARKVLGRPHSGRPASNYASLSPIGFHSAEELRAKLKTYEQSARKKRRAGSFEQDTSAANKMFVQSNPARTQFELQRLLWSAVQEPIDIGKFSLPELPVWISSTSLVALSLQIWRSDSIEKQKKDPTILSLELASISCIAFREKEDYAREIKHTLRVKIKEHSLMTNGPATDRNNATLEIINKAELGKRLNTFFAEIDAKYALLLVYDAEQTSSALKKLGVDVSFYTEGIGSLLYGENRGEESREDKKQNVEPNSNWGQHLDSNQHHSRSVYRDPKPDSRNRSLSPRRQSYSQRTRPPSRRDDHEPRASPPPAEETATEEGEIDDEDEDVLTPAKVYVIDVRALFLAVSRFEPGGVKNLLDLAGRLDIPNDFNGNECRLLIEAWKSMASGKAIDEQYAKRTFTKAPAAPSIEYMSSSERTPNVESDEEADPNDVPVNINGPQPPQPVRNGTLRPPVDDYDSDDSDF